MCYCNPGCRTIVCYNPECQKIYRKELRKALRRNKNNLKYENKAILNNKKDGRNVITK